MDVTPNFSFRDCSGLVLPGVAGSTTDILRAVSDRSCSERAESVLREAYAEAAPSERSTVRVLDEVLARMSPLDRTKSFGSSLASFDVPPPICAHDGIPDTRNLIQRALCLARLLVGSPGSGDFFLLLPMGSLPGQALYFPHLHAIVRSEGDPVAIASSEERVRFTWPDGETVTFPCGMMLEPGSAASGRFQVCESVTGVPVLNESLELATAFQYSGVAEADELPRLAAAVQSGFDVLSTVWPAAWSASIRGLRGLLLLKSRGYMRSHTSPRLRGTVLTTADDPVKIADTLCHELSHDRMNLFLEHDPMIVDDGVARHQSPWRPDLRPLIGVLNGVHAFLNVSLFYQRMLKQQAMDQRLAELTLDHSRSRLAEGWKYLAEHAVPTTVGAILLDELEREVKQVCN